MSEYGEKGEEEEEEGMKFFKFLLFVRVLSFEVVIDLMDELWEWFVK